MRAILGALGDPAAQRRDLGGGERDVGIGRWHPFVRKPRLDPLDDFAQLRLSRDDRDRAAAALGERLGAHVEPQLGLARGGIGPVALETFFGQNGANVAVVVERFGGA